MIDPRTSAFKNFFCTALTTSKNLLTLLTYVMFAVFFLVLYFPISLFVLYEVYKDPNRGKVEIVYH